MDRSYTCFEATKHAKEVKQVVSSKNIKPSFVPFLTTTNPTPPTTPLKIQKLTQE
jgi:hypothetical protein